MTRNRDDQQSAPQKKRRRPNPPRDVTELVPTGLRVSAALAWRFIVVIAALYVIVWLAGYFSQLMVPIAIALLLAALMAPGRRAAGEVGRAARRCPPRS